jgi:hypothetical protein
MELKTIKEFAHKNNLGEGLMYSNGVFKTNLDSKFNAINNKITEIDNTLNKVYKVKGSTTVNNINTMTVGNAMIGYVYNMLDSGIITNGIKGEFDVVKGDNIVYTEEGWDEFSVSLALALRAGKNISIENDAVNALGYTYDKEKESFSIGSGSATNQYSYAEGSNTEASGGSSHAEGSNTEASGDYSHAEGYYTDASGDHSHAEGYDTVASGYVSHAEGDSTIASGLNSHAEGKGDYSLCSQYAWVLNSKTIEFTSDPLITIGDVLRISNDGKNQYIKVTDISENKLTITVDKKIELEHNNSNLYVVKGIAYGNNSHSEGDSNIASGQASHAEGKYSEANGTCSHAEGYMSVAQGDSSHAEG